MKCPEIHDECRKCEAYQNGKCLLEEEFLFLKWFFEVPMMRGDEAEIMMRLVRSEEDSEDA